MKKCAASKYPPNSPHLTHVICLYIQRAVTERIFAQVAVEVIVDEHPVKGRVKRHEYRSGRSGGNPLDPIRESAHGFRWFNPGYSQLLQIQPADGERARVRLKLIRFQFKLKSPGNIINQASPDRKHRELSRHRAGGLHVHANEYFFIHEINFSLSGVPDSASVISTLIRRVLSQ